MEIPLETLMLIAVVIIATVVALLELRYVKGHRKVKVDAAVERDDAFNAVTTTRAVADSLRQNGRDTTEADVLIYKAESAYGQREFLNAIELAKRAKTVLLSCKEKDLISMPAPAPEKEESKEVPSNQIRKLPTNYLESKFMIDSLRDMTPDAGNASQAEANGCLDRAQACFDSEDYCGALAEAMKAKRLLSPSQTSRRSYPSTVVKLGPTGKAPPAVMDLPESRSCPACRVVALDDDVFCRKCGTRLDDR
jgi:hypothetical protein